MVAQTSTAGRNEEKIALLWPIRSKICIQELERSPPPSKVTVAVRARQSCNLPSDHPQKTLIVPPQIGPCRLSCLVSKILIPPSKECASPSTLPSFALNSRSIVFPRTSVFKTQAVRIIRSASEGSTTVADNDANADRPWKTSDARLVLEDGSIWRAKSFGASRTQVGEVVFNTSLTGYQEILTDPSYAGQFVLMTNTHIGNTGVNIGI
ncbi:carbamoyl-phosphate synthase small chain, chloroplastic-like [Asparagus officinalis]|uniref:carbamoyl-phosphate synthase small chain, chloroplastic-like n=1 Tax=Asparagus officinalis TaxID=4686 RepID=UPI00098E5C21|nr:carbamoyl-phosphate synthase small chain, chloroplastic-like [Asparagus officinalis]